MADGEPSSEPIEPRHEVLKQLYAYWLAKRGDRRAPSRADIDPIEIAAQLPYVVLVDVEHDPLRLRFRLIGTAVVKGFNQDLTGRYFDEIAHTPEQRALNERLVAVATWGPPLCAMLDYTHKDGRFVRYERLALPLSSDGATVDMLFGGIVFDAAYG
ncbi:MAG TPA: PAS domain-containing protein [Alphaproteobacteria bacterium]|jgi:hypothetical protein